MDTENLASEIPDPCAHVNDHADYQYGKKPFHILHKEVPLSVWLRYS